MSIGVKGETLTRLVAEVATGLPTGGRQPIVASPARRRPGWRSSATRGPRPRRRGAGGPRRASEGRQWPSWPRSRRRSARVARQATGNWQNRCPDQPERRAGRQREQHGQPWHEPLRDRHRNIATRYVDVDLRATDVLFAHEELVVDVLAEAVVVGEVEDLGIHQRHRASGDDAESEAVGDRRRTGPMRHLAGSTGRMSGPVGRKQVRGSHRCRHTRLLRRDGR